MATRIPLNLLVLDGIGTVLAGVGVAGLLTDLSGVLPFMANRNAAGIVTAVGFVLMGYALTKILQHIRARSSQASSAERR